MTKDKFNPIAQIPPLPGAPKPDDELLADIEADEVDSSYPSVGPADPEAKKRQIEIRLKPPEPDEVEVEKEQDKRLLGIRMLILVILVLIVLAGIFLTLNVVPKLATDISAFGQSLGSIFSTKKTSPTTGKTNPAPASIALVATSTYSNQSANPPVTSAPSSKISTSTQSPVVTTQPSVTAKLSVNILSTYLIGNRTVVRFDIKNIGTTVSGPWSFTATLPSSFTPAYHSKTQQSLAPKSGIIFTLSFTPDRSNTTPVKIDIFQ